MALQELRVVRAGQLEAQQPADTRLRRPLLLPDAAVGHDAAGIELPARPFNAAAAAKLYTPVCVGGSPGAGATGAAWIRRSSPRGWRRRSGNTVDGALHRPADARLESVQRRFPGRPGHQRRAAGRQMRSRVSPRVGVVYDLTGQGATILRGGFGHLLRPAAGQHGLRHDRERAGRAELDASVGTVAGPDSAGGDPDPTLSLNPTAFDFKPPRVNQWNVGIQHKVWRERHPRRRLRRLDVDRSAAAGADQRLAVWRDVPAAEPGSDPRPQRRRWGRRRCRTTSCVPTRATATSACGTTAATRTTTRCRRR